MSYLSTFEFCLFLFSYEEAHIKQTNNNKTKENSKAAIFSNDKS